MKKKLHLLLVSTVLVLAACGNNENEHEHQDQQQEGHGEHALPNGDLQVETASVDVLPSFLEDKPEEMQMVYAAAGKAAGILEWIPCYCGCGDSAGHQSSKNCFINEIREDGTVVWDDHGTRCLVCMEIAVESIKMYQEGKSLPVIRKTIDDTYNEGYATPTNTPMPS